MLRHSATEPATLRPAPELHLAMPLANIDPKTLTDTFNDARSGHKHEALDIPAPKSTPVLAVAAPPFSESMKEGVTGFLYGDPRKDNGADFERVLTGIENGELQLDRAAAAAHLEAYSLPHFADRVDVAMNDVAAMARRGFPA